MKTLYVKLARRSGKKEPLELLFGVCVYAANETAQVVFATFFAQWRALQFVIVFSYFNTCTRIVHSRSASVVTIFFLFMVLLLFSFATSLCNESKLFLRSMVYHLFKIATIAFTAPWMRANALDWARDGGKRNVNPKALLTFALRHYIPYRWCTVSKGKKEMKTQRRGKAWKLSVFWYVFFCFLLCNRRFFFYLLVSIGYEYLWKWALKIESYAWLTQSQCIKMMKKIWKNEKNSHTHTHRQPRWIPNPAQRLYVFLLSVSQSLYLLLFSLHPSTIYLMRLVFFLSLSFFISARRPRRTGSTWQWC